MNCSLSATNQARTTETQAWHFVVIVKALMHVPLSVMQWTCITICNFTWHLTRFLPDISASQIEKRLKYPDLKINLSKNPNFKCEKREYYTLWIISIYNPTKWFHQIYTIGWDIQLGYSNLIDLNVWSLGTSKWISKVISHAKVFFMEPSRLLGQVHSICSKPSEITLELCTG